MTLTYRWLGAAGLELAADGFTLLVDPFFTRPSRMAMALGLRVASDETLSARYAPRADAVLVTHPHYDHLLDVPGILRRTGAVAYGSPNACTLLDWQHIPAKQAHIIRIGDILSVGPFGVEVLAAYHRRVPFAWIWNGPLDSAPPRLPLRLSDYRMDACYCFRITLAGARLLIGSPLPAGEAGRVDVMFCAPYQPPDSLAAVLRSAQPAQVIPIHWDDFNRPLDRPLRPMILTPGEGQSLFPPLRRVDLAGFAGVVKAELPSAAVAVPNLFQMVEIS